MTATDRVPCQAGCRTRADADGGRRPVYARLPARICRACVRRLTGWLAGDEAAGVRSIPDMWARLPDVVWPGSVDTNPDERRGRRIHSPAPLRPVVLDLLDVRHGQRFGVALEAMVAANGVSLDTAVRADRRGVGGLLELWGRWVREERRMTQPAVVGVSGECWLLRDHLYWIVAQPWVAYRMPGGMVEGFYPEMRQLHGELADAVGEYRPRPIARCWTEIRPGVECRGPILPNDDDDDGVHCPRCGRRWGERQLRHLGLVIGTDKPRNRVSPNGARP